jgi:hypothetical protein
MTQEQFFAAITHIGSPIFGVGHTADEALQDAKGEACPAEGLLADLIAVPCSGAVYDRVTDIGGDILYMTINGLLILPGEE